MKSCGMLNSCDYNAPLLLNDARGAGATLKWGHSIGILRCTVVKGTGMKKPVSSMIGIGLLMLILAPGVIMWTSRDLSYSSMSTKPVGTSTLSHGDPAPVRQGLYQTDQSSSPLAGP